MQRLPLTAAACRASRPWALSRIHKERPVSGTAHQHPPSPSKHLAMRTPNSLADTQSSDVYDRGASATSLPPDATQCSPSSRCAAETHDRLARASFQFCEDIAKKYDAPTPVGVPASDSALPTIALSGEIECTKSSDAAPPGKVFYVGDVSWQDRMYQGCTISAQSSLVLSRVDFSVPVDKTAFRLKLTMPSSITVDSFKLTDLKITSGPAPADGGTAGDADAAAPSAAASSSAAQDAAAGIAAGSGASAEAGAATEDAETADLGPAETTPATSNSPAAAPTAASRPKPMPILVPGTFVANHKASSGKTVNDSVQFIVDIPWNEHLMYPKAKLSMHVPPVAKMITSTLPSKPRDGKVSITLTLPKAVGTQSFTLGQVSITSGPKPAPRVPQPVIMPAQPPPHPVAQSMPLEMANLPVAPVQLQSTVQSSIASANAVANAAAAVLRPRAPIVAMPVAPQAAPAAAPKPAAPKRKPAVPKRKAAATTPAAAPSARQRRNPPAAAPAPAQQLSSRSGRSVKPAQKFGSKGEFEGAASSFKSSPVPRRALPPVSVETSVPAFAMPGGGEIYAYGLHAGVRKRFRAKVLRLRTQFPRIVVEYLSTEDGSGTNALELPEMRTAYLTTNDIEQINP